MRKNLLLLLILGIVTIGLTAACMSNAGEKEVKVKIHTTMGDMVVKLYNETPKTRDNFIKLVKSKFYDSTLFHRVIQTFMVQAGDPSSKKAAPGAMLGNGDIGYTVPAEFVPTLFHKKGALAMARQGDDVNPTKASSGCQFYIVQGKTFTNDELNTIEQRMNMGVKQQIFTQIINQPSYAEMKKKFVQFQNQSNIDSLQALTKKIEPKIDSMYAKASKFTFTAEERQAYTTVGGAPHLDGNYTVFGEVVEGLDIIDKIAATPVDKNDRPLQDVKILSMEIMN
jgi:cyclophilin family peptidyl-prolyl cis-trans isomerase